MNIFRFEFRSILKNTLIWSLSLSAVCLFMMIIFPAYRENADAIRSMIEGFPDEALKAMGMDLNTIFGVLGFYSFLMVYLTLIGGVQAAALGVGILSREYREKNSDFLMTKPVKRSVVVTSKLCAALLAIVITNIIFMLSSVGICLAVSDQKFSMTALVMISLTMLFIQLVFLSMGAVLAVFIRIKSVYTAALALNVVFFALSLVESLAGKDALQFLTPFKYFDPAQIVLDEAYEPSSFIIVFAVAAVCTAAVYIGSIRRDIPTA